MNTLFQNSELQTALLAAVFALIGFFLKALWDRFFSDKAASVQILLERLNMGAIGKSGKLRLKEEAQHALRIWQMRLPPPKADLTSSWPTMDACLAVRRFESLEGATSCPSSAGEGNVQPLFLRLEFCQPIGGEKEERDRNDYSQFQELREEITARFTQLSHDVPLSAALIKTLTEWKKGFEPKVWLALPKLIIRSEEDADTLLTIAREEVRRWLPNANIMVEIFLADDLASEIARRVPIVLPPSPSVPTRTMASSSGAAAYAYFRSRATLFVKHGCFLGEAGETTGTVPVDLLNGRLPQALVEKESFEKFKVIAITGPPGSGKSQLAGHFADNLVHRQQRIVCCFLVQSLMDSLQQLSHCESRHEAVRQLGAFFSDFRPSEFRMSIEARIAFTDALVSRMQKEPESVVLLIDDVDQYKTARTALMTLLSNNVTLPVRYVVTGRRMPAEVVSDTATFHLKCSHWSRPEAEGIIVAWAPSADVTVVRTALSQGWLSNEREFSLYQLRVVLEQAHSLEHDPLTLLENTIRNQIRTMEEALVGNSTFADSTHIECLQEIKNSIESGGATVASIAEILSKPRKFDLVSLLGDLSWFTRFNSEDAILRPSMLPTWTGGKIPNVEAAKAFLEAGAISGVFSVCKGSGRWNDKLIADGAVALYIERKANSLANETVTQKTLIEMIAKLDDKDSLSILSLACGIDTFLKIIHSIATVAPERASVVTNILSDGFVARLQGEMDWIRELRNHLIRLGLKLRPEQMPPLGLALARLASVDTELEEYLCAKLPGESNESCLAAAVRAHQFIDDPKFFSKIEEANGSPIVAAMMAACVWSEEAGYELWLHLLKSWNPSSRIAWAEWCKRQEGDTLLRTGARLAQSVCEIEDKDEGAAESLGLCLELGIKAARKSSVIRGKNSSDLVEALVESIRKLACARIRVAEQIIKWIVLYWAPEVADAHMEWRIDDSSTFIIARRPMEPLLVRAILERMTTSARLQLASTSELKGFRLELRGAELVRDNLPSNFTLAHGFVAANFATWDGNRTSTISKDEITRAKLRWRPRIRFDSAS